MARAKTPRSFKRRCAYEYAEADPEPMVQLWNFEFAFSQNDVCSYRRVIYWYNKLRSNVFYKYDFKRLRSAGHQKFSRELIKLVGSRSHNQKVCFEKHVSYSIVNLNYSGLTTWKGFSARFQVPVFLTPTNHSLPSNYVVCSNVLILALSTSYLLLSLLIPFLNLEIDHLFQSYLNPQFDRCLSLSILGKITFCYV